MATLLHHHRFDGNLGDSVGGSDFTDPGGLTYQAGQAGQELIKPASTELSAGNVADLNFGAADSFSVTCFLTFPIAIDGSSYYVRKKDGTAATNAGFNIWGTNSSGDVSIRSTLSDGANFSINVASVNLAVAARHHVALVVDRTEQESYMYLNGTLRGTQDISSVGSLVNAGEGYKLGRAADAEATHYDDLRVYAGVLSAGEVGDLAEYTGETHQPISRGRLSGVIGRPLRGRM